jgi:hypothetical protein
MSQTTLRLMAAAVALSWSGAALAQGTYITPGAADRTTRVGTRGANFLEIGIGARANGLGSAAVASIEGPGALFWNPANIAAREGLSAFASYMQLFGNSGITDVAGAITVPVGQGALGFAIQQYSSGTIARTTEQAPDGNDPAFPGTFEWVATAVSGHYARNVTDRLTAAAGVRYAQEGIDFAHNSYVGLDISTRFRTGLYGLTVAASLINIGSTGQFNGPGITRAISATRNNGQATGRTLPVEFGTRDAQLPTAFRFGVLSSVLGDAEALLGSNPSHSVVAELDFNDAIDTDLQSALGVEYSYKKAYYLRTGKRFFNEQHSPWRFADGWSFGGGVRLPAMGRHITFDYAWVTMGELQHNQVLSFDLGN